MVLSEAKIFEQKPHPRNLGNPSTIAFSNLENCPTLPSNDEFAKAESVIGEFIQTSSTDPPFTIDVERNTLTVTPKDFSLPSSTIEPLIGYRSLSY